MNSKVVLEFIAAINSGNVKRICSLMTVNHMFIDSQDNRVTGRENMRKPWEGYFSLFPDYKIEVTDIFEKDSFVCIFGYASGTYMNLKDENKSNYWRIPAAWKAIVNDGLIEVWQVYADNSVVIKIVNHN
jgi:hypothetical protein